MEHDIYMQRLLVIKVFNYFMTGWFMQDLRSSFMATGGRLTTKPGLFSYRNTYHEAVEEDESETTVSAEIDAYSLFYLLSCR